MIDSVKEPKKYITSDQVRKELCKEESVVEKCDLAYMLPQGGIAIHLKESKDTNSFIQDWKEKVNLFGGDTEAHKIKKLQEKETFTTYIKNVPQSVTIQGIEEALKEYSPKSVHRLRYSHSRRALPIIKVTFDNEDSYNRALNTDGISIPRTKKRVVFSPERTYKVVWCYNCQRFGHIAACCLHTNRCGNCGGEDCQSQTCTKPAACTNCSGNHPASSSACPAFKDIAKRLRLQTIL